MDNLPIAKQLDIIKCYNCMQPLGNGQVYLISQVPTAMISHVTCKNCNAQSLVTISFAGVAYMPIVSDLTSPEVKKFFGTSTVSIEELVDLHNLLKKGPIWKFLEKKEHNSVKKLKS